MLRAVPRPGSQRQGWRGVGMTTALYHYCALHQLTNGNLAYADGFANADATAGFTHDDSARLREAIANRFDPPVPASAVTILSITRLTP